MLSLITYLDRVCISQVKDDIQRDLHLSKTEMGMVFSAFVLGYALFEVPGGYFGDIWGARRVLTLIVLWWSAWTALTGCVWYFHLDSGWWIGPVPLLFNSFILLCRSSHLRPGRGGGLSQSDARGQCLVSLSARARAQGAIWMSARIGGALAPIVIDRLALALGWRPAFWVLGLVGVAWCIGFCGWYRDRPEDTPLCNQAERDRICSGSRARSAADLPACRRARTVAPGPRLRGASWARLAPIETDADEREPVGDVSGLGVRQLRLVVLSHLAAGVSQGGAWCHLARFRRAGRSDIPVRSGVGAFLGGGQPTGWSDDRTAAAGAVAWSARSASAARAYVYC